jgi:elongation factor Ts
MATITAAMVKQLRDRSGAGMSDCKGALTEAEGDLDKAFEILQVKLRGKVENRAGRVATEGAALVLTSADGKSGAIVEVNCQTDFVANGDGFKSFANAVVKGAVDSGAADLAALEAVVVEGRTLKEIGDDLTARSGEKHAIRRVERVTTTGVLGSYIHFNSKIAVLVAVEGEGNLAEVADEVAIQAASMKFLFTDRSEVSADVLAKQREIFAAQVKAEEDEAAAELAEWTRRMQEEPENITDAVKARQVELEKKSKALAARPQQARDKIIDGKLNKWFTDVVLLEQASVKEEKLSLGAFLATISKGAKIARCVRFEVGEGVEKAAAKDFATEVAEMAAKAAGN